MNRFTRSFAPLLACAAMVGAPAAFASEPPQKIVRYDASELTTEAGREAVRLRLKEAAESVCPSSHRTFERMHAERCVKQVTAKAERELERRIAAAG